MQRELGHKRNPGGEESAKPEGRKPALPEETGKSQERRGMNPFWGKVLMIAGLAVCAAVPVKTGCEGQASNPIVSEDADSDAAEMEEDAGEEAEAEAPETGESDSDAGEVEDESGGGEEAEADAEEDESSDVEDGGAEDADCVTSSEYERIPTLLPEEVGGSRQFEEFWYRTDTYSGPECETAGGDRVLERIMFRLETPIADTSPEGLRNVVRRGGITKGFGAALDKKIVGLGMDHIVLAGIIDGGTMGVGMPVGQLFDGERYLVWFNGTGENPDGTRYASLAFFDTETRMPAGGANVNEGEYHTLPNGNRVMATGAVLGASYSARVDILGPADDRIADGEMRTRAEDGLLYRFRMELPDGWALYPFTP